MHPEEEMEKTRTRMAMEATTPGTQAAEVTAMVMDRPEADPQETTQIQGVKAAPGRPQDRQ